MLVLALSDKISARRAGLLDDYLFYLVNNLVHPHLDFFLVLLVMRVFTGPLDTLISVLLSPKRPPRIPLIHQPFPLRNKLSTDTTFLCCIFLVKLTAIFSEILPDLSLLILSKQRARTWTPDELLKAILNLLRQLLSPEVPDRITVFQLLDILVQWKNSLLLEFRTVCVQALALVAR